MAETCLESELYHMKIKLEQKLIEKENTAKLQRKFGRCIEE